MKKGFTLIELLAVIVILAIIALIAIPVGVNIINDSKTSGDEQSLKLYEDMVQKMIVKKQMQDPAFRPKQCIIQSNGDLECEGKLVSVEMKGTKPTKGIVTIEENKVNFKNIVLNNKKYYKIATLINDSDKDGQISMGG